MDFYPQVNKPRPRFKEAPTSEDEQSTPARKDTAAKKFRKAKPSFLTGRGIVSATRFLNYHFMSLQSAGNDIQCQVGDKSDAVRVAVERHFWSRATTLGLFCLF